MKNIVYIHTHDVGRFIEPYGYAVDTPNLKSFAGKSVIFRRAFDCCPTCSPARASLLSGQYPHQCGMLGLAHRGFEMYDQKKHLASFLRSKGYETALFGIQHETNKNPEALGYDRVFTGSDLDGIHLDAFGRDMARAAMACGFIESEHEKPFFLSLGLSITHRPFPDVFSEKDNPDMVKAPSPIPDTAECRSDWAAFSSAVRHMDRCFGCVFDTLSASGRYKDTMVLVTTDHGAAFPGMKCTLSDDGCGVMFLLRIPGHGGGKVSDALISQLDFFPTVCEWIGADPPDWLEGNSLMPLIYGSKSALHDAVFSEINYHAARDIQRSVRTDRFRYVRRYDDYKSGIVLPNIDDGITKRFLRREAGLESRQALPDEQLFDLYTDPSESFSVAFDKNYSDVLSSMRGLLDEWQHSTDDPVIRGGVPFPHGAKLNRQDGIDPINGDWI